MDVRRLFTDFHLPIASPGERHYHQGWLNTPCPFCSGNPGNHLGYCYDPTSRFFGRFVCYRCGGKGTLRVLSKLLRIDDDVRLIGIIAKYGITPGMRRPILPPTKRRKLAREADLPPLLRRLKEVPGAVRYLVGRKFDPEEIEGLWKVMATGPGSIIRSEDGRSVDFSYRIIVPVFLKGKLVTYQGRDWTGKSSKKYLACPPWAEDYPIKDTLYGADEAEESENNEVVLMEGVTDVWRYGPGAVACFGIKHRSSQIRELARRFDRVTVAFDPEGAAKIQARKIARELEEWGLEVKSTRLPRGKDPGDMNRNELKKILEDIR